MKSDSMTPAHSFWSCIGAVAIAVASLGGCGGSKAEVEDALAPRSAPGLVATLKGVASAVSGKVRVYDRGDGITVLVSAINLPYGSFRVAFHENGNCSSPNGFSAGPAWAPPGRTPENLTPPLINGDGNTQRSFHVSGVRTTGENGLAGRSVMLYGGLSIDPIVPGVRNDVMACGVFEPTTVLF